MNINFCFDPLKAELNPFKTLHKDELTIILTNPFTNRLGIGFKCRKTDYSELHDLTFETPEHSEPIQGYKRKSMHLRIVLNKPFAFDVFKSSVFVAVEDILENDELDSMFIKENIISTSTKKGKVADGKKK